MDAILNAYITKNKLGIHQSLLEIEMPESEKIENSNTREKSLWFWKTYTFSKS